MTGPDTSVQQALVAIARFRAEVGVSQAVVAEEARIDQSRVCRIEKGELIDAAEINRVLDALAALGAKMANAYKIRIQTDANLGRADETTIWPAYL
jgi:predicted transcriptional regulator